jgi:hypothetical protein
MENFFASWSGNMAYILGFTMADGCLANNSRLQFDIKDRDLLEKFVEVMGIRETISNRRGTFQLYISSKNIVSDLVALGVRERKTHTMALPDIQSEYRKDFVRGYFDGDGSAFLLARKKESNLLGTRRYRTGS